MSLFAESRLINRSSAGSKAGSRRAGYAASSSAADTAGARTDDYYEKAIAAQKARDAQQQIDEANAVNEKTAADNTTKTTGQMTRADILASGGTKTSVSDSGYSVPAPTSPLTREQKQQQAQADAALQAQYISDPEFHGSFQQITDYLQQLKTASPEQQQQIHNDMSSIANSLVDEPFNHRVGVEKDALSRKIKQLNDTYHELSESEELKLQQAVQNLDIDAAKDLNTNFDDIFARAGTNSGLLRRIADQIVETHDIGEKQKEDTKRRTLESAQVAEQQDQENEQALRDENIYGIEQERTAARSTQLSDLINESEQNSLLQAERTGTGDINPAGGTKPAGSTLSSIRSTLPTVVAPAGSSLDLARKAAAGLITPEQQKAARDALLYPTTPTTPAAAIRQPTTAAPKATTPTSSGTVINPNTGQAYTGGAAARLAARLGS